MRATYFAFVDNKKRISCSPFAYDTLVFVVEILSQWQKNSNCKKNNTIYQK